MKEITDYSKKWVVLSTVGIGIFLTLMDTYIVNVALPTLSRVFDSDFPTVQWVVLGYMLTLTSLMLVFGRLGDMIGKKHLYLAGLLIFILGSLFCALAQGIDWLIAARIVQAIGGAVLFALGMAIITEAFPSHEKGKAMGAAGAIIALGVVAGPVIGGILLAALSWQWIFIINIPIGITGIVAGFRFIPHHKPGGRQKFDYPGAMMLFASLLSLLLALTRGQRNGFTDPSILGLFTLSVFLFSAFIAWELRSTRPLVDLRMFENKLFSISLVNGFLTFACLSGTVMLLPFYLENVLHYSTLKMGLLMSIVPIGLGLVSPIAGNLSDRLGTRPLALAGLLLLMLGYFSMTRLDVSTSTIGFVLLVSLMPVGMGVFQSPNNSAIMGSVPEEHSGIASGFLSLSRSLGQTAGTAVFGAVWAGYVFAYSGKIPEQGATGATAEAQVAGLHQTLLVVTALLAAGVLLNILVLFREKRMLSIQK